MRNALPARGKYWEANEGKAGGLKCACARVTWRACCNTGRHRHQKPWLRNSRAGPKNLLFTKPPGLLLGTALWELLLSGKVKAPKNRGSVFNPLNTRHTPDRANTGTRHSSLRVTGKSNCKGLLSGQGITWTLHYWTRFKFLQQTAKLGRNTEPWRGETESGTKISKTEMWQIKEKTTWTLVT